MKRSFGIVFSTLIFFLYNPLVVAGGNPVEKISNEEALAHVKKYYGGVEEYKKELCKKIVPSILRRAAALKKIHGEDSEERALEAHALKESSGGRFKHLYHSLKMEGAPIFHYVYNTEGSYEYLVQTGISFCWEEHTVMPPRAALLLKKARIENALAQSN